MYEISNATICTQYEFVSCLKFNEMQQVREFI